MTNFELYRRWLVVAGIVIAVLGTVMALTSGTPLFAIFDDLVNSAFWSSATPGNTTADFQAWMYGVWGATIAGWGVALAFIAHYPFARREPWAWRALALGTAFWFVLDTGVSAIHGVVFNLVFNVLVLALVGIPLFATRAMARRQPGV